MLCGPVLLKCYCLRSVTWGLCSSPGSNSVALVWNQGLCVALQLCVMAWDWPSRLGRPWWGWWCLDQLWEEFILHLSQSAGLLCPHTDFRGQRWDAGCTGSLSSLTAAVGIEHRWRQLKTSTSAPTHPIRTKTPQGCQEPQTPELRLWPYWCLLRVRGHGHESWRRSVWGNYSRWGSFPP